MTTKDLTKKKLPMFTLQRCKQCGICSHFCPAEAIVVRDNGTPFLARPEICTSCGLCEDMCPDWAVCLDFPDPGEAEKGTA
jgi:2-oxoglutarate ferredoxin oxidoreductase subunit delta